MINPKELRIGNKVQPDKEHASQFNNIRVWSVTQIYEGGFTVDYHWPGKWFEAIRLSPEILQACGFENREGYLWFLNDDFYVHFKDGSLIHNCLADGAPTLLYLHQLQNLVFCLTGNELTINLEKVKV